MVIKSPPHYVGGKVPIVDLVQQEILPVKPTSTRYTHIS